MKNNNENNEESKLMLKNSDSLGSNNSKKRTKNSIFNKNQNYVIYIIIISAIFLFFFFMIKLYKKEIKTGINDIMEIQQIIETKNYSLFLDNNTIIEINNFISICLNGTLINPIQKSSQNPKISLLIPVYNSEKTIKATIRSIQNQNMSDIEIIVIDDNSNDSSVQIIEELQKEDKRIKLLKTKKNKGTLYTRSIGALNSKGKYIMSIDHDDLFINNILNICYEEAELNNIDIIEFSAYNTYNTYFISNTYINKVPTPHLLQFKEDGLLVKQPELSSFIYQKQNDTDTDDYKLIDGLIWGKCINSLIYKKSLNLLGDIIYKEKVYWTEDRIVNFALFRIANSFKFMNISGIIHYVSESMSTNKLSHFRRNQIFHDELINVINVLNLTRNTKDEKFVVVEFKNAWKMYSSSLNKEYKQLAMDLYREIMNSTIIEPNKKEELTKDVKSTLTKENEIFSYYNNYF